MSKTMNDTERAKHLEQSLECMKIYLDMLKEHNPKKADLIAYWLQDYSKFLEYEQKFNSKSMKKYKRGDIVQAHLGFNIGSEFGGLHYCIVVENDNDLSNPVITVVPLTSLKQGQDPSNLKKGSLYLGDELYIAMNAKTRSIQSDLKDQIKKLDEQIKHLMSSDSMNQELEEHLNSQIDELRNRLKMYEQMIKKLSKLKQGSIALISQITTISKIRIYDPKRNDNVLAHIRVSNEKLDLIDEKIKELFTKKIKNEAEKT